MITLSRVVIAAMVRYGYAYSIGGRREFIVYIESIFFGKYAPINE